MTIVIGDGNANTLTGTAGSDELHGEGGMDVIVGNDGEDYLFGGDDKDIVHGDLELGVGNMPTAGAHDQVHGGAGDDLVSGGVGGDTLWGDEGNDTLVGGSIQNAFVMPQGHFAFHLAQQDGGNDYYDGGDGYDTAMLIYDRVDGVTIDASNPDSVTNITSGGTTIGTIFSVEKINFTGLGSGSYVVTAGEGWDVLNGAQGNDIFHGGGGIDWLQGGNGSNQLHGDGGDDYLFGGDEADVLDGGAGLDWVSYFYAGAGVNVDLHVQGVARDTGGGGVDTLVGIENVFGTGYGDLIIGNEGDNEIRDDLGGNDLLAGDGGNDTITVLRGGDSVSAVSLVGGEGDDRLKFAANHVGGTDFVDTIGIEGGSGNDQIEAYGVGLANIFAGDGDDWVIVDTAGGTYNVSLGTGRDHLVLDPYASPSAGASILVTDFQTGPNGDAVDLGALLSEALGTTTPFQAGYLRLVQSGNDTLLQVDVDGGGDSYSTLVTFQNVLANSFTPENFGGHSLSAELYGSSVGDTIHGGAFADHLEGGEDWDTLYGDGGDDWLYGDSAWDDENAIFGANDVLHGGDGNDMLIGGSGDDQLDGGEGNDTLRGGAGSDMLSGGNGFDIATYETSGQGVSVSLALPGQDTQGAGWDTLTSIEGLVGSYNADTLVGNDVANSFRGLAGADQIFAQGGNDTVYWSAGDGDDTIYGGDGIDTLDLRGSSAGVTFNVTSGKIVGGGAQVTTYGFERIYGTNLSDTIMAGTFEVHAAGGDDLVYASITSGLIDGGDGRDSVSAYIGFMAGTAFHVNMATGATNVVGLTLLNFENITTGASDDQVVGTGGDDGIFTGAGNDLLNGGAGADHMEGGDGSDVYLVDNAGDLVQETAAGGLDVVSASINYVLTDNVETLILSGSVAVVGTGNALDNAIVGNGLANMLDGRAGNDQLNGGAGADTMRGGLGNDMYVVDHKDDKVEEAAGEGTDMVLSSVDYVLAANVENLMLTGSAIKGTGNALANTITGNDGANFLYGGAGADVLIGGLGNDTYYVENIGDVATEETAAGIDTVNSSVSFTLGANVERLVLTGAAAINGTGNGLANTLTGNGAANVLDGGAGADVMKGAGGNDIYYVDHKDDLVEEVGGGGIDTVHASVDYSVATQNIENLILTGAAIKATGNGLANTITGNANANFLYGGGGADKLIGGLGNDTYFVDGMDDVVTEAAGEGTDTVNSSGSYTLGANLELLRLTGTAAINGTGNALANTIVGNANANVIDGGAGADTMKGGAGDDSYRVDNAGDAVTELAGEGTDTVLASLSHTLGANVENLTLTGASAINGTGNGLGNIVNGNAAANVLNGAAGDDALHGGGGIDTLTGGTGLDSYWFETALGAGNVDKIVDFAAIDDTIMLDRTIFTGIAADGALAAGAFRLGSVAVDADDRILYDAATGNIYHDADGAGGAAAVLFAQVAANTALTHADFFAVP